MAIGTVRPVQYAVAESPKQQPAVVAGQDSRELLPVDRPTVLLAQVETPGAPHSPKKSSSQNKGGLDRFSYAVESANRARIKAVLNGDVVAKFLDTPLQDVVEFLEDRHKIEIEIDTTVLDGVGVGTDPPITFEAKRISMRSALRLMLRQLELDYIIQNEVALITTEEVARTTMETHLYSVRRLIDNDVETLAEVIQQTIQPDSWRNRKMGDGEGQGVAAVYGDSLVITHNQRLHEKIEAFLQEIDRHSRATPGEE